MLSTYKRLFGNVPYWLFGLSLGAFLGIILLLVLRWTYTPSYRTLVYSMHTAVLRGDVIELKSLLETDPNLASVPDEYGQLALFNAVDKEIVEVLIDEGGLDINTTDRWGKTLLHYADSRDHAQFLVARGADVDVKSNNGENPLSTLIRYRRGEVAELLVDSGADVDIFAACGLGMTDKVRFFLEQDPNLVHATDLDGGDLLHTAAALGQLHVAKILIAKGAAVEHGNRHDRTPLFEAAIRGHLDVIELLLASGADERAKDKRGWTAFDWAIDKEQNQAAEMLRRPRIIFKLGN